VTGDKALTIMDQPVIELLEDMDFDGARDLIQSAIETISTRPEAST
jgi:hypothetical protein